MVNLKSFNQNDPKFLNVKESEFFRLRDSNNLYLRVGGFNRRVLCSNDNLQYGIGTSSPVSRLDINEITGNCLSLRRDSAIVNFSVGLDNSLAINCSQLNLSNPLGTASGGTGQASYAEGDLLIGNSSGGLDKVTRPNQTGYQLISTTNGLAWSSHVLDKFLYMTDPVYQSAGTYVIETLRCRKENDSGNISLDNVTTGSLISSNVLGTVNIKSDSLVLQIPELDFVINDVITVSGVSRKIIGISSGQVTIGSEFPFYNLWKFKGAGSLSTAAFRFGTKSLLAPVAVTDSCTFIPGTLTPPSTSAWTLEFFFRLTATTAAVICASSGISINLNALRNITVSIGQGSTFNIANPATLTGVTIAANTWYHFALAFNGTVYRSFINGTLGNTTTSSLQVSSGAFSPMNVGGNGYIDAFRLSNIGRYVNNFTAPTAMFTLDVNTVSLNNFEGTTVSSGDSRYEGSFSYSRNAGYDNTSFHIANTYAFDNSVRFSLREESGGRKLPMYLVVTGGNIEPISIAGGWHTYLTHRSIISNSTSVTDLLTSLNAFCPSKTKLIKLRIVHNHVGTTSCGVIVNQNTYLETAVAGNTSIVVEVPIISQNSITTKLSVAASTTSYSIFMVAFYLT